MIRTRLLAPLVVVALATGLAGCGSSSSDSAANSSAGGEASASTPHPPMALATATHGALDLTEGWVASVPGGAMGGMKGMQGMKGMKGMKGMDQESVAYATLANGTKRPDALVGVSTPAAAHATLHRTESNGSSGTMVSAKNIGVPAGGRVTLKPGSYHVMLSGLKAGFEAGSTIPMTWHFRSGAALTATFPVIDVADRPTNQ